VLRATAVVALIPRMACTEPSILDRTAAFGSLGPMGVGEKLGVTLVLAQSTCAAEGAGDGAADDEPNDGAADPADEATGPPNADGSSVDKGVPVGPLPPQPATMASVSRAASPAGSVRRVMRPIMPFPDGDVTPDECSFLNRSGCRG
jgi:hypothetical protein